MKLILLSIAAILLSSNALAADLSQLGSMTEYTCIVDVETRNSGGYYRVKQTCDTSKSQVIGNFSSEEKSPLLIQIIKVMRDKGMHLVTQSNDVYDSSKANGKLLMTFQKRDIN
jgi:hypothetical protein